MSGLNKVQIIGRLGKDPEVKNLQSGSTVANFSLAVSETWKDKQTGEKKEKTEWINIVLWGNAAEVAQKYLHKGDMCYVEGKIQTRSYEKDGITKYVTEVQAFQLLLLGGNKSSETQRPEAPPPMVEPKLMSDIDGDLPF